MISRDQVRMARTALKWTAEDLAKKAGVAVNTVRRWENGADALGETLAKIEAALVAGGVVFIPEGEASMNGGAGVRMKD